MRIIGKLLSVIIQNGHFSSLTLRSGSELQREGSVRTAQPRGGKKQPCAEIQLSSHNVETKCDYYRKIHKNGICEPVI